ncbi:MAG: hypothetical protein K0R98_1227 [Rickettsiaceae bacterium]|nr:hypothetical protein [Rickettsiaceae bacterium]
MSKHHHPHPLNRKHKHHGHENHDHHDDRSHEHQHAESHTFDWLLDLLKKVMQVQPDERGILKGDFTRPEASYFNQKINECRKESGITPVNEHEHPPEFTKEERKYTIKEIAKEMQKDASPLAIVRQKPNEITYGNADDPDEQLKYTFEGGKWLITPGRNVDAVIIDPAGKVIEIKPGPHIHQYGDGGNLTVAGACKGHHDDHGHSHSHKKHHHHDEHEHHHHKGPCSDACGHGAKSHEHHHYKHGRSCGHSHY